jgi:hypothetical protein
MNTFYNGKKVPKEFLMLRLSDGRTIKDVIKAMKETEKKQRPKPPRVHFEELEPRLL